MKLLQNGVLRKCMHEINQIKSTEEAEKQYPALAVHRAVSFSGAKNWKPEYIQFYEVVAEVRTADLEQLFEICNIGPENKIERLARMHSASVGDIVQDGRTFHMIDPHGFTKIEIAEEFAAHIGFQVNLAINMKTMMITPRIARSKRNIHAPERNRVKMSVASDTFVGRGPDWESECVDLNTGNHYKLYPAPCGIPECYCDAIAVPKKS